MDFSGKFGLTPDIIEKDYILGWLLAGIAQSVELSASWVFKGGTCLKKCYFETYRFSEDLDFTLKQAEHQDSGFLVNQFKEITGWIYSAAGIEFPPGLIKFDVYKNSLGKTSVQGKIAYLGPLQRGGDPPRVKLDLTANEALVLEQCIREVNHPYSDKPEGGIHIRCYCFEEIFAEKVRALAERLRPRDLYDVIHLYRHDDTRHGRITILNTLEAKCRYKGISMPSIEILERKPERAELVSEWENMLGHQVPVLPPFEQFWQELPEVFDWLYRSAEKATPAVIPTMGQAIDTSWHPPSVAQAWGLAQPLEVIRYAASNRLCVDLAYQGDHRLIEPYSLRRTQDGNLLLYAVKHDTGENRSYRVDRIEGAKATKTPFVPRYAIELTGAGPISAPHTRRAPRLAPASPRRIRHASGWSAGRTMASGPSYIFRCSVCNKRFMHKSYNSVLSSHKDKRGYPCPGRSGIYVTTKFK